MLNCGLICVIRGNKEIILGNPEDETKLKAGTMDWLEVGNQGIVRIDRIVAVGSTESAPVRRLLAALPLTKIISLTGGQRRRSVIVLDSDHVVLTPLSIRQLRQLLVENAYER